MSIKSETLAVIGIRLLVVYLVIELLTGIPMFVSMGLAWGNSGDSYPLLEIAIFAPLVLLILCAIYVWAYAEKFSQLMIGRENPQSLEIRGSTDEIAGITISVAGLLIVLFSIPDLISQSWMVFNSSAIDENMSGDFRIFQESAIPGLVAITMKGMFGLMLLTTSAFWVRVLKNIREYGIKEQV